MTSNKQLAFPIGCVLAVAAASGAPAQVDDGAEWSLVWADEFDGDAIDPQRWTHEINCWGGGNDERQCYTERGENSFVADGTLHIVARREDWTGPALPESQRTSDEARDREASLPFTSARLTTRGQAAWRYGRIEVRASLPGGQGVWPAIWMLPEDGVYGGWAASGEIDIMEAVNLGTPCDSCADGREDRVLGTLHYGGVWPENVHTGSDTHLPPSEDGFHTFAVEWTEGEITWFVDGAAFATQTADDWYSVSAAGAARSTAPFDEPFHLLLNLAVGGGLPEGRNLGGVSEDGFPKTMRVDWVRVYGCPADPDTMIACRTTVPERGD